MALILLTNDDGIQAEGLRFLEASIRDLGDIIVVAPDRERSAVSHGLTIHTPLAFNKIDPNHFTLNGTPADCVIQALRHVTASIPDLVISGINHGANLGDDIMYSGTVAAAREASRHAIPSLAISQAYDEKPIEFKGGDLIHKLVQSMLEQRSKGGICLNVNIPVRKIRGVKLTRQGCAGHFPHFNSLDSSEGEDSPPEEENSVKSEVALDFQAIVEHYVSITPLQRDQTDYATVQALRKEIPKLFPQPLIPGIRLIGRKN